MYQKSAKRDLFLQMMDDGSPPNPNKPCCSRSVLKCTHTGRDVEMFSARFLTDCDVTGGASLPRRSKRPEKAKHKPRCAYQHI